MLLQHWTWIDMNWNCYKVVTGTLNDNSYQYLQRARYARVGLGVETIRKWPFSNHQSQQRIQILGYHISVDAVIRKKYLTRKIMNFLIEKKTYCKKIFTEKEKENHSTTFLCCWRLYVAGRWCSVWFYGFGLDPTQACEPAV